MNLKNWLNNVRLGAKNETALVIVGGQASGKTTAAKVIIRLLKLEASARNVSSGDFESPFFLSQIYTSPLVVVDEINTVSDGRLTEENRNKVSFHAFQETLKPLISSRTLRVDRQGKSAIEVPNNVNVIILASDMVEPSEHDRRYIVTTPLAAINEALGVL